MLVRTRLKLTSAASGQVTDNGGLTGDVEIGLWKVSRVRFFTPPSLVTLDINMPPHQGRQRELLYDSRSFCSTKALLGNHHRAPPLDCVSS
jgi:hypothetical protein